jgi:hypothetical protein
MTTTASFTVDASKAGAFRTCLAPLAGVGFALAGTALAIEVYSPFGAERLDKVREVVLGIDPGASEV